MRTLGLFLCLVSSAFSATITLNTTCNSASQTVNGGGNCGVSDGIGYGKAQASATISIGGNVVSLNAQTSAAAAPGVPPGGFYTPFSGAASVTITADLFTTGALRSGFVRVNGQTTSGVGGAGTARADYSLGSALSLSCSGNLTCGGPIQALSVMPFQLGTAFIFSDFETAIGSSDPVELLGDAFANSSETFTFFEADGITPVSVFDAAAVTVAPEPTSWGLFVLGLAGLGFGMIRFKN